jgi:hypothetical protein
LANVKTPSYRRSSGVDVFRSVDGKRLVLFRPETGELTLLLNSSVDLWFALGNSDAALTTEAIIEIEALRKRGFVDLIREQP